SNGTFISKIGGDAGTRMADAKKVIKKLVSSSDLTKGANFGLMDWDHTAKMIVNVSSSGASEIYKKVDSLSASGGTYLDAGMRLAQSYLTGSNSPINKNASCQKTFLIVLSDGSWYDRYASRIAETLYKTRGIKTFVIGFHTGGNSNYTKLAKAGGTYPDSPLYSSNWQHLHATLANYIRQAISSRFTASAVVVMPDISSGDHIFQSTFEYKKDHQWKGELTKYKLKADGKIGTAVWKAGEKLDAKKEADRQIWTIANNAGITTSINNFTSGNLAGLKALMYENSGKSPTDDEATNLINFVRGVDVYDEDGDSSTTDKRWKLGDIYHSQLAVVGAPSANYTNDATKTVTEAYYRDKKGYGSFKNGSSCGGRCLSRKEVVYVGANDGMLHAFDSKTGAELWGFVPPTILNSLRDMDSVKANSSHSIYGVDGSPVVKDIYYDSKWRTVLLAGMGRGGKGYFALDVTDPDAPSFLFAFKNDPINKNIYHWDEAGTRTELNYTVNIPAEYDYSKLGDAWSNPMIVLMPDPKKGQRWVAVFGAGYNGGVNIDYGSAVYVVDLEDKGKVLKRIDLADTSNNIANAVPAALTAITADTTSLATYKGAMFYFADLEGKFWKLNLTDQGTLYETTQFFNAEATQENDRMAFFQVAPSIGSDGKLWLYYGTGNQQKLQRMSSDIKNRIYGIKDVDFPKFKAVSSSTVSKLKNTTSKGSICPTSRDLGWYVDLDAHEKVTGYLEIDNETIYASRYTPNSNNICNPGSSVLSEHNYACGNTTRRTNLGRGIATGVTVHKGKIYIGISGSESGDLKDETGKIVGTRDENLIVINPKKPSKGKGEVSHESWREVF
ncbi:MAG TPA: VWA domain-containing protein, partial [Gammaproteobacteria bacterium]|nr:VWA domain-containing protein [Gammaproteobacteria bacterium]